MKSIMFGLEVLLFSDWAVCEEFFVVTFTEFGFELCCLMHFHFLDEWNTSSYFFCVLFPVEVIF